MSKRAKRLATKCSLSAMYGRAFSPKPVNGIPRPPLITSSSLRHPLPIRTDILAKPWIPAFDSTHHFLNGAITNQAWLYAYRDVYWGIAVLTLLLAPWCMLLNRPTSDRRVMQ
jgi:hypothetical protein